MYIIKALVDYSLTLIFFLSVDLLPGIDSGNH